MAMRRGDGLLLRAVLRAIAHEAQVRGGMWYTSSKPQALALLGENDAAIEALRTSIDIRFITCWWYRLQYEHAYDGLRHDPRFVALLEQVKNPSPRNSEARGHARCRCRPDRAARPGRVSNTH